MTASLRPTTRAKDNEQRTSVVTQVLAKSTINPRGATTNNCSTNTVSNITAGFLFVSSNKIQWLKNGDLLLIKDLDNHQTS
ncbi:hypothetical protein TSUD_350050 [Trifolium subterraneum]|uniref:Uncharacterized protein n=1 Tax=Trifolium subterraneum TaxID=3900 RepID=A0A2Z6PDY1_TRISU|nr:hypothetical protein TSUD_350050 [Trifolium subterraneum]